MKDQVDVHPDLVVVAKCCWEDTRQKLTASRMVEEARCTSNVGGGFLSAATETIRQSQYIVKSDVDWTARTCLESGVFAGRIQRLLLVTTFLPVNKNESTFIVGVGKIHSCLWL
jgi:hypothetical protein